MEPQHGVLKHVVGLLPPFHLRVLPQHPLSQPPQSLTSMFDNFVSGIGISDRQPCQQRLQLGRMTDWLVRVVGSELRTAHASNLASIQRNLHVRRCRPQLAKRKTGGKRVTISVKQAICPRPQLFLGVRSFFLQDLTLLAFSSRSAS
jgi:hypothetical protein